MRKLLILLLFISLAVAGDNPVEKIAEKLEKGYELSISKDMVMVYSQCDTLIFQRSKLSDKQLKKILSIKNETRKLKKEFRKKVANKVRKPFAGVKPDKREIKFYFIADEAAVLNAARNGILEIDSSRVKEARHSLDGTKVVMRLHIPESDSVLVEQLYQQGKIFMPTWKYFTVDSLRNYLNKSLQWTKPEK